ncbi:MAG: tetratricopeptide repeat protein, partial [Bacteroidota bacterium]
GGFRGPETLTSGLKGTLIALLTFSLFSYPFDISSFTLQLVVVVALFSSTTPALITIKGRKSLLLTIPIVVLLIAAGAWYFPKRQAHYDALKTWHEAEQFHNMRSYDIAAEAYKEAFPILKNNGLFLQMYGKALSMNGQHEKSNEILQRATQRFSSYILYNTIGDNHKALGNFKKAETAYKKSSNMVPGLLLPKYLLAKLYVKSDQNRKAKQTAKKILNSTVKVESSATREIMNEMKNIVTPNTEPETRNTKL